MDLFTPPPLGGTLPRTAPQVDALFLARLPRCVVCGGATNAWCLGCKQPLHRLPSRLSSGCGAAHTRSCPAHARHGAPPPV
jgi:hypothetical protein